MNDSLLRVAAAASTLQRGEVKLDQLKAREWATEAVAATQKNPGLSGTWAAASALINYESMSRIAFSPSVAENYCFSATETSYQPHPEGFNSRRNAITLGYCTIVLDDLASFENSVFAKQFHQEQAAGVTDVFILNLDHVHLLYRGKALIPFAALHCQNCIFSVENETPSAKDGRELVRTMLLAENGELAINSEASTTGI